MTQPRMSVAALVAVGLVVAAALAAFGSPFASSEPDGLERVAIDEGFPGKTEEHALADLPTAGYRVRGVDDDRLSTGLAGLLGVTLTFLLAGGVTVAVRRASRRDRSPAEV